MLIISVWIVQQFAFTTRQHTKRATTQIDSFFAAASSNSFWSYQKRHAFAVVFTVWTLAWTGNDFTFIVRRELKIPFNAGRCMSVKLVF